MQSLVTLLSAAILFAGCAKQNTNPSAQKNSVAISNAIAAGNGASIGITGDTADVATTATAGFVLMGGSTDVDPAIAWMLQRSGGGDVVVIRSTGTDAYNDYMYGLYPVNSVETLLIDSRQLANDATVADKIKKAECLFIAGGDQWQYVSYWKGTLVNDAINYLINTKKVPVGGTSAGCMVLGQYCYDAQNGSVTSQQVLNNPYNNLVTFTSNFISIPFLQNIITDTHYDNPDRRGRQTGFMARLFQDSAANIKGIGVQEETAVAIDENGMAKVFGFGKAFFLRAQTNLGLPEVCKKGKPLTWYKNQQAVDAYTIAGSQSGNGSADIANWTNFSGGKAQYFYARKGSLMVRNQ